MNQIAEFETHITVALLSPADWSRFAEFCLMHDFKCVHIALEAGQTPSQPMLTFHGRSEFGAAMERALRVRHDCHEAGFEVTRVKLEVAPENCEIGGVASGSPKYYEHHIKLLLPADADVAALQKAVVPHEARLSRNARSVRDDGQFERFVT